MLRKGWDADEEHLNPMAYVALHRIHLFLGQDDEGSELEDISRSQGGESAVAREFIQAIHDALNGSWIRRLRNGSLFLRKSNPDSAPSFLNLSKSTHKRDNLKNVDVDLDT